MNENKTKNIGYNLPSFVISETCCRVRSEKFCGRPIAIDYSTEKCCLTPALLGNLLVETQYHVPCRQKVESPYI